MSGDAENNAQDSESVDRVHGEEGQVNSAASGDSNDKLKQDLAEANARVLRAQAELENFRKRIYRDTEQQLKFATLGLLKDILEVADNLTRALDAAKASDPNGGVAQGIQMVQSQFLTVLNKHHCLPIEAVGKPFDPNYHEALTQVPHAEVPAGNILQELRKGYMLHDRVVRTSQVILSAGAPQS